MTDRVSGELRAQELELWRGERCLFHQLSLNVTSGCGLAVRGPNGCGKTSLIRVLAGLTEPETGDVLWNDQSIRRDRHSYLSNLAYLGHLNGLKGDLTAIENLEFHAGFRSRFDRNAATTQLELMGVDHIRDLPVRVMSAGQKRRVALAAVWLSNASLWLLDEPAANLDKAGVALVGQLMDRHLEHGGLIIVAAHQELITGGDRWRQMEFES